MDEVKSFRAAQVIEKSRLIVQEFHEKGLGLFACGSTVQRSAQQITLAFVAPDPRLNNFVRGVIQA